MADPFDTTSLDSALAGTIFAGKIHAFKTIESTNTWAMREAAAGAPHGTVCVAGEQTAGRGRGAHQWHSQPDAGLYLSMILRPPIAPVDALWISLAAGLGVQSAVANVTAMVADIRWPNDLMIERRKFGGILTEMSVETDRVRSVVTGIGINVNHAEFPLDLSSSATSLRLETGRIFARQDLLLAVLQAMHLEIEALMSADGLEQATGSILSRLNAKSTWIFGKRVFVDEAGGYTGVTAGLDARGFLRVETAEGIRTVLSGGVREPRPKG